MAIPITAPSTPFSSEFTTYISDLVSTALSSKDASDIARVSIALGLAESALTDKSAPDWPDGYRDRVTVLVEKLTAFVASLKPALSLITSPRARVVHIANAVWSLLSAGSFSKDVLHSQHLSSLCSLLSKEERAKKQLDCAGIGLAVHLVCRTLGLDEELSKVSLCLTEDHCFLSLDGTGSRESSCEVATTAKEGRGLAVSEEAWNGWLYLSGHPYICSETEVLVSCINSLDPTIGKEQRSRELVGLKYALLELIEKADPVSLYPAAACSLGYIREYSEWNAVHSAFEGKDAVSITRQPNDAWSLYDRAIKRSAEVTGLDQGVLWFPHSFSLQNCYWKGYLAHLISDPEGAKTGFRSALQAAENAAVVLARYRIQPGADKLLYDGVELAISYTGQTIEDLCEVDESAKEDPAVWRAMLVILDAACGYYAGRSKPGEWLKKGVKAAGLVSKEARKTAAEGFEAKSGTMRMASGLWSNLEVKKLKTIFESADTGAVDEDEGSGRVKRARKS